MTSILAMLRVDMQPIVPSELWIAGGVLMLLSMAITTIDVQRLIIPDPLSLALLCAGLIGTLVWGWRSPHWAALSSVASFGLLWSVRAIYFALKGRVGLGFGDVKLGAASAAWIGLEGFPTMILIASLAALSVIAVLVVAGRPVGLSDRLPFGPFLMLGTTITWFSQRTDLTIGHST